MPFDLKATKHEVAHNGRAGVVLSLVLRLPTGISRLSYVSVVSLHNKTESITFSVHNTQTAPPSKNIRKSNVVNFYFDRAELVALSLGSNF